MSDAVLFPLTNEERIAFLHRFLGEERKRGEHMAYIHPERREYWVVRIAQTDEALAHLEALREATT